MVEIVGAIVNNIRVTQNIQAIDASRVLGLPVEYISRAEALERATREQTGQWQTLANSSTLFVCVDGFKFRRI